MRKNLALGVTVGLIFSLSLQGLPQSEKLPAERTPYFFDRHMLDFDVVLSPPPSDDSKDGRRDHATVIKIQEKRNPAEIKAAQQDDQEEDIFIFRNVVGESFLPGNFPLTKAFSSHLKNDSEVVDPPLKHLFNRPRPYVADSKVRPVCKLSSEPSYPSGHAMLGYLFSYVLAQMVPEKRDAILKRADVYAHRRV